MKEKTQNPLFLWAMALLVALAIAQVMLPDRERSAMENRPLRQAEKPALATIASGKWMEAMEDYVADQFPHRDAWMMVQAVWDAALMRNERGGVLVGKEGWLFTPTADMDMKTARDNVKALNEMFDTWAEQPVSLMIVPMSSQIYPEYLPTWYRPDDQWQAIQSLYASAPSLKGMDITRRMEAYKLLETLMDAPKLYYRTDHHWTYDGARLAYQMWLEEKEIPLPRRDAPPAVASGFTGTYFSRAPSPLAPSETFVYDNPTGLVLSTPEDRYFVVNDVARINDPQVRDKYAALLYGNWGYCRLRNSEASGGTLLVIKDSYANALLPMLAQHYQTIEIVDLRYYYGEFEALFEETEAEEILCIYGLHTLMTDRSIQLYTLPSNG